MYVFCKNCDQMVAEYEAYEHYPINCQICNTSTCNKICDLYICQSCDSCDVSNICDDCFKNNGDICLECYEAESASESESS